MWDKLKHIIKLIKIGNYHLHFFVSSIIGFVVGLFSGMLYKEAMVIVNILSCTAFSLFSMYVETEEHTERVNHPDVISNMLGYLVGVIISVLISDM